MIKSIKVCNLNKRMNVSLNFFEDINIITGKNGSGKTTLLKLLWYAISGNLERIIPEIQFDSFELATDNITIGMELVKRKQRHVVRLTYELAGGEQETQTIALDRVHRWDELDIANRIVSEATKTSVFFPTFRRIEGGFSINSSARVSHWHEWELVAATHAEMMPGNDRSILQQGMLQLSNRLSVGSHQFVASISTDDLQSLLTSKYAEVSEKTNRLHMDLSRVILEEIRPNATQDSEQLNPVDAIALIKQRVREIKEKSESLLRPFTVLSKLIAEVFQYKGIRLADPVTFGDAKEAIASHLLSAGEKQMLSFLCYNAFAEKSMIFIDEPEISLHADWQRALFPVLKSQTSGSQFVVATHSPFIYAQYADRELKIVSDNGDSSVSPSLDRR